MTDVAIPDTEVFKRFLAAADEGNFDTSPEQTTIDIIARILNATSAADVLARDEVTHARDYIDVPFALTAVRFNKSDYDAAGPAFYALLEGADVDGAKVTITCGAKNVIAQAWKLADIDALPVKVVLRQSPKPTEAGFYVMWLEAAPADF